MILDRLFGSSEETCDHEWEESPDDHEHLGTRIDNGKVRHSVRVTHKEICGECYKVRETGSTIKVAVVDPEEIVVAGGSVNYSDEEGEYLWD